jgi:hypothetical protein
MRPRIAQWKRNNATERNMIARRRCAETGSLKSPSKRLV